MAKKQNTEQKSPIGGNNSKSEHRSVLGFLLLTMNNIIEQIKESS